MRAPLALPYSRTAEPVQPDELLVRISLIPKQSNASTVVRSRMVSATERVIQARSEGSMIMTPPCVRYKRVRCTILIPRSFTERENLTTQKLSLK